MVHAALVEKLLSAPVLALDRDHRAVHLVAGEIGNLSDHMRQSAEQIGHATALVVDDKKCNVIWAVIDRHGKHIGLQGLALARTGRTCQQAVRAVVLLVNIQIAFPAACSFADQRAHSLIRAVLSPPLEHVQLRKRLDLPHIQERQRIRDRAARLDLRNLDPGDISGKLLGLLRGKLVKHHIRTARDALCEVID